jgi:hypothetical protein
MAARLAPHRHVPQHFTRSNDARTLADHSPSFLAILDPAAQENSLHWEAVVGERDSASSRSMAMAIAAALIGKRALIEWNGAARRRVSAEAASLCVWMWGVICPVLIRWVPYPDGWGWRVRCQVGTTEPAQFLEFW